MVWASSLVPEAVLDHCRPAVVLFDSKTMTLEEVTAVYDANPEAAIVRLHSGDPSVYGAIAEQIDWCVRHGLAFEIVPGVTSMAAAAAMDVTPGTISKATSWVRHQSICSAMAP